MDCSKFLKRVLVLIITCFMFVGFAPTVRAAETYTVTYTDGSSSEKYFPDQVYTVNAGDPVPAFEGTPTREGFVFASWNFDYLNGEQTKETVTRNRNFTAQWVTVPKAFDEADALIQNAVYSKDEFWYLSTKYDIKTKFIAGTFTISDTTWNEEKKRFEASVTITDPQAYSKGLVDLCKQDNSNQACTYVFNAKATPEENLTIHFVNKLHYTDNGLNPPFYHAYSKATFDGWLKDTEKYPSQYLPRLIFNRAYDVTFKDGVDGSIFADKNLSIVETAKDHAPVSAFGNDPIRIGYKFNGWASQNNKLSTDGTALSGDDVLTAQWLKMNDVTITFNSNGGDTIDPVTVQYGERYSFPSSPLSGYSQDGWYLYDNGQLGDLYVKGGKSEVVEAEDSLSLIMARKVLAPSVKLKLTTEAAEIGDNYQFYYPKNSTRILTAEVTEYSDFDYTYEWFKDGVKIEGENGKTLRLAGNVSDSGEYSVTVTATQKEGSDVLVSEKSASASVSQKVKIMKTANSLYYDANGGEGGPTNNFTNANEIVVSSSMPTRTGYTFEGWNTKADGSGKGYKAGETIALNDNGNGGVRIDLYAQWKPITFIVSFGDDAPAQEVDYGKTAVRPADPKKEGYAFAGWYHGDTEYDFNTPVTDDVTLTAKFEVMKYTVSFSDGVESQVIEHGKTAVKPVDPKKGGHTFIGWYDGDKAYDFNTPVTSDLELTAKFEKNEVPVEPEKPTDPETPVTPQTPNTSDINMYFYYGMMLVAGMGILFMRKKESVK